MYTIKNTNTHRYLRITEGRGSIWTEDLQEARLLGSHESAQHLLNAITLAIPGLPITIQPITITELTTVNRGNVYPMNARSTK